MADTTINIKVLEQLEGKLTELLDGDKLGPVLTQGFDALVHRTFVEGISWAIAGIVGFIAFIGIAKLLHTQCAHYREKWEARREKNYPSEFAEYDAAGWYCGMAACLFAAVLILGISFGSNGLVNLMAPEGVVIHDLLKN